MLSHTLPESVANLEKIGISRDDAYQLRRISMTLHRWHELECGDSNDYASWSIVRGKPERGIDAAGVAHKSFTYDDAGRPYIEKHLHSENKARYTPIADREAGAKRRLARIMARYPTLTAYVQTDPRGCALYILTPQQVNGVRPDEIDAIYSRGVAVYK